MIPAGNRHAGLFNFTTLDSLITSKRCIAGDVGAVIGVVFSGAALAVDDVQVQAFIHISNLE